jgi:hypothetical protein
MLSYVSVDIGIDNVGSPVKHTQGQKSQWFNKHRVHCEYIEI